MIAVPDRIETVEQLEELLSRPTEPVVQALSKLKGDVLVLGVGGKMGPSLARMAKRASQQAGIQREIIGVSRFASDKTASALESHGITTIRCDLLEEKDVSRLPEAPNILYLAGMKFGSTGNEPLTWATNSYVPAIICQKFHRSRIVALSTGNVYGLVPIAGGGSRESDPPAPQGEYAMSCLGRERIFEHFSNKLGIPATLIRLNYACDLRYGVLVDLAQRVLSRQPVDLSMGYFNTIWQADANAMILQSLLHAQSPPLVLSITGPEALSVRDVCERLGQLMNREPSFTGEAAPTALLSNAQKALTLFGPPRINSAQLIRWVADWLMRGESTLGKPTRFESRSGKF